MRRMTPEQTEIAVTKYEKRKKATGYGLKRKTIKPFNIHHKHKPGGCTATIDCGALGKLTPNELRLAVANKKAEN